MVGQKLTQNDKDWCALIFPKNNDFIYEQVPKKNITTILVQLDMCHEYSGILVIDIIGH